MSTGLHVSCFDSITHEAILINGENRLVVESDNIDNLAIAINPLLINSELRVKLSMKNIHKIWDFDPSVITQKVL